MSTQTGDGVDVVLAEIVTHKPEAVVRKKDEAPDIRSPVRREVEEVVVDPYAATDNDERKPKPKKARKPRTVVKTESV
jgi:hypothetical protein